jgi:uncharacterized protein
MIALHTMTAAHHDHILKVADLIDSPGASRSVQLALPAPEGFDVPLVRVREPLHLAGVVESVVDGLLVRGTLEGRVEVSCARCLEPLTEQVASDVAELFADPSTLDADERADLDDGYEITDAQIDLDALVRDALAPALPSRPLCREDCAGLCAQCGANRNEVACGCVDDTTDGRWAALEGLQLPDEADDTQADRA